MKTGRILIAIALGLGLTLILLVLLGSGTIRVAYAQGPDGYDTYYVAPEGDCGGMTPCFSSVQAAVDAVDDSDDTVKVASGTYIGVSSRHGVTQVVYLNKTLILRGGYTTTNWGSSDPLSYPTVLDAQGQGRALYIAANISPKIEGFHITGGNTDSDGGGVYVYSSSPTLSHNIVTNNRATQGGGIGIDYGSPLLRHNTIMGNYASSYGGGIYMYHASPTVDSNHVLSNTTGNNGGGVFIDDYSSPVLVNNVIARNYASSNGAGIYIDWYSTPSIVNNTIVANRGPSWAREGIFMFNSPSPIIVNNIILTHRSCIEGVPYTVTLDYNLLWDCRDCGNPHSSMPAGPHDMCADPKLTDDYHLTVNSPAINTGIGTYAPSMDFDDEPRPASMGYDIGADEYYGPALDVYKQAIPVRVHPGESLTYTLYVTNTGNVTLTATITEDLPEQVTPAGILTWTPIITAPGGVWVQQVTVTVEESYSGTITNVVQVSTDEGATGTCAVASQVDWYLIYLPLILRGY